MIQAIDHDRNALPFGGGLLCLGAIIARGQSSQHSASDEMGMLRYQKANMHLCPEDKWTLGEVPGLLPEIWFVANPSVRRTIGLSSVIDTTSQPIRTEVFFS